ncbi:MAG: PAS domain-containing protein [Bdellovibrionales bacterium]|nr:PAS domain-containing protein [Oligoflexia bacterium]
MRGSDHVFEYVNQAHITALGFDATGKSVIEAQSESVEAHDILDNVFKTGATAHLHEIAVTVGDRLRYFDFTYAPSRDRLGKVNGIMVLGSEVTERVEADVKVKRAHQDLERILMQVPAAVAFLKGERLVFEIFNERYLQLTHRDASIKHKAVRDVFPELEEVFHQAVESVYKNGVPFIAQEHAATLLRNGKTSLGYFSFSIEQVMGTNGTREGLVILAYEVTEQVKLRKAVEANMHELRTLSETVPQIIWSADTTGVLNYTNPRWTAYSGSNVPGDWGDFVHPDDVERVGKIWMHALETGEPYETEFRIRRIDGVFRWFLVRASPIKDENRKIVKWYGTCTDIEEQRQTVLELQKERESREQFVSMLSHDLRNPLSAAKMSAQIISRDQHSPEKLSMLTTRIVDNLNRANKMIENLLDANKIKAGLSLDLQIEEFDLVLLIEDIAVDLGTVHGDRFLIEANPKSIKGHWSSDGLRRVIENLCVNAVKYGEARTPIRICIEKANEWVGIGVHNCGSPISLEDQKKLFDPYQRTVSAEKESVTGWGLGLTLVRGVVQAHGGTVEVESKILDGTTFKIKLPMDSRNINSLAQNSLVDRVK